MYLVCEQAFDLIYGHKEIKYRCHKFFKQKK